MSSIDIHRLALVCVKAGGKYRYGTGYLITNNLVVTARHVWTGKNGETQAEQINVWFLGTRKWCPVKDILSSRSIDACLLQVINQSISISPLLFGKYDRSQPVSVTTVGFPGAALVKNEERNIRDSAEVQSQLFQDSQIVLDNYEMNAVGAPLTAKKWGGMSGAPVFAEGHEKRMIGIVYAAAFDSQRLQIIPVNKIIGAYPECFSNLNIQIVPSGGLETRISSTRINSPSALLNARNCIVPFAEKLRE